MNVSKKRRLRRVRLGGVLAIGLLGLLLSACSSSKPSTIVKKPSIATSALPSISHVSNTQIENEVSKALNASVPLASVPKLMRTAMAVASEGLSSAQLDTAYKCWLSTSCVLGSGHLTIADLNGDVDNTWQAFSKMDIILQALHYPEIGKYVYGDTGGQLPEYLSDLREFSAEGVNLVVTYNAFGAAAYAALAAAQRSGMIISSYVGPQPGATASDITTVVGPPICQVGKEMAALSKQLVGNKPVAYMTGIAGNAEDAGWQDCATKAGVDSIFNGITNWTTSGAHSVAAALIASGKPIHAILYSYSNPVPGIVSAYQSAHKSVPPIITFTTNNATVCLLRTVKFPLYVSNALNWAARVSVTAVAEKAAGISVPHIVKYPMPFFKASASQCTPSAPAGYPGTTALVPLSLSHKMLG